MKKVKIKLSEIQHIRGFAGLFAKYPVELDLKQGRYIVDAKSPMGIFALDLLNPIEFIVHSDDKDMIAAIVEDVRAWIV